jgi:putative Holliday junction resolvase
MATTLKSIMALDVGAVRVGVAVATVAARLPRPLITLTHNETLFPTLQTIAEVESVFAIVVGFPRNMEGKRTAQTTAIEEFVGKLKQHFALPIRYQDESLTSKHAEAELRGRGRPFDKGDIDSLAATYILDDFLRDHPELGQPKLDEM